MSDGIPIVTDITARAVIAPLARPIKTSVGEIPAAPLVLIDIATDIGVIGRAYLFGYTPKTLRPLVSLLSELEDLFVGKPVSPVGRMRDACATFRLLGRQGLLGMALSGVDMALWDALGKAQDLPVSRLLGGDCPAIPAYDSYGIVDPDRDADDLERSLKQGFRAIKTKLGGESLAADVAIVGRVREIIGTETRFMVDYNQSLTVPEAIRRIKRLEEFGLEWVEEPVPAEDLGGHAMVRNACDTAIQTGENWWFPENVALAISSGASDFAMLDLMKIGGISGWIRASGQAEGASLPVSSHLFIEASAHALAVTPTAHYLEYLDVAGTVLKSPMEVEDGCLRAQGPGLGIEWDEDAVTRYRP